MSAEPRRVSLKSVPTVGSTSDPNNKSDTTVGHKKTSKNSKETPKEPKTKRFVLTLNEDIDGCNEFSFNELLKTLDETNNDEPNGDEDDDPMLSNDEQNLRKLEKHFQLKYGPKKRRMIEDHIDKGNGYDDTDPFIDNGEAYDELVPSTLTTKYGGFYINCGELEFRPLSPEAEDNIPEEEEDDEDNIRPVIKRKKKLKVIDAKRRRSSAELIQKNPKNNSNVQVVNKTVAQMLKHKKSNKPIASNNNNNNNNDEIEEIQLNDSEEEDLVSSSVREVVNSVAKGEDQPNGQKKAAQKASNGSIEAEDLNLDDNLYTVKLPNGLPQDLLLLIDKIKKMVQTSHDGKRNVFTTEVNKLLSEVDERSRSLPQHHKTQIFAHLASKIPVTKQTLISKTKKASIESYDYELNSAIARIVQIVDSLTPHVFRVYQSAMELAKETSEHNKLNGIQSDVKVPRKVFGYSSELRRQIDTAIKAKIHLFDQINHKNQSISLKDYLYEFLDQKIKPIFPKGWMTLEVLKRRAKWIKEVLPPDQLQQQQQQQPSLSSSQQSGSQSSAVQSSQSHHSSPSTQTAIKIQTPTEKLTKSQPSVTEKPIKPESDSNQRKTLTNSGSKMSANLYQTPYKVSDNMSEGLGSKFMPNPKETKNSVNNDYLTNITSIDLSTKSRSSPKPLNISTVPTVRVSPMNLKTSPNQTSLVKSDAIKSNSSSPSPSPLSVNSILSSNKTSDKSDKLSREECLTKVIERSLGDYPNSYTNNQRNSKANALPQNSLHYVTEMFAKGFNSSPKEASKSSPEVIEIASSPEPYIKGHQTSHQTNASKQHSPSAQFLQNLKQQQQQQQHQKTPQSQHKISTKQYSMSQPISSTTSVSNISFSRTSEVPKKKYNSSTSLIQLSNTQKEQELRQNAIKSVDSMLLQSPIGSLNNSRNSSRDTSITITPVPQSKTLSTTSDSSVTTSKHNSIVTSRHMNSAANAITSTTPPTTTTINDSLYDVNAYLQRISNTYQQSGQIQIPPFMPTMRYMDSSSLYASPTITSPNIYPFPYHTITTPTSTTNKNGTKDK